MLKQSLKLITTSYTTYMSVPILIWMLITMATANAYKHSGLINVDKDL